MKTGFLKLALVCMALQLNSIFAHAQLSKQKDLQVTSNLQIPRFASLPTFGKPGAVVYVHSGADSGYYVRRNNATWMKVNGGGSTTYTAGNGIKAFGPNSLQTGVVRLADTLKEANLIRMANGGTFVIATDQSTNTNNLAFRFTSSQIMLGNHEFQPNSSQITANQHGIGFYLKSSFGEPGNVLTQGSDFTLEWKSPLPPQTGEAGKFLTTNGTAASWGNIPAPAYTYGTNNAYSGQDGAAIETDIIFYLAPRQGSGYQIVNLAQFPPNPIWGKIFIVQSGTDEPVGRYVAYQILGEFFEPNKTRTYIWLGYWQKIAEVNN